MKLSIIALAFSFSSTSVFATDTYKCFLDSVPYKKSPVVTVLVEKKKNGDVVTLEFTETSTSYRPILKVSAQDNTDDVNVIYENKKEGVLLSFYVDEGDALGLGEGTIKSPVMNGDVRCLLTL